MVSKRDSVTYMFLVFLVAFCIQPVTPRAQSAQRLLVAECHAVQEKRKSKKATKQDTPQELSNVQRLSPKEFHELETDLELPPLTEGRPLPGKRVKVQLEKYRDSSLFHTLYLPTDYKRSETGKRFPLIVEFPGNGPFKNKLGDQCSGKIEDCQMAYGISGGSGYICLALPFVSADRNQQQRLWWGDADATVEYCKLAIRNTCDKFQVDPNKVVLCGFSRGAIACNYIGLRDDEIAGLWCAMICHSHYDGVRKWPYSDSDRKSAIRRIGRLSSIPQLISQELSTRNTKEFLESNRIKGRFTFLDLPFANHSTKWFLFDCKERKFVRDWLKQIVQPKMP